MASKDNTIWWIVGGLALLVLFGGGGVAVVSSTYSDLIKKIAYAIAIAERGPQEIESGQIARNNPGDIEDSSGNLITYATVEDGWNALYRQVSLFFSGSRIYNAGMTIAEIAQHYVGTSDWVNWAANVSAKLGVPTNTRLSDLA
jgi:hypothetical protein